MRWLVLLLPVFVMACTINKSSVKLSQPVLTQQEAEVRFAAVSNVSYEQEFLLDPAKKFFTGKIDIAFEWRAANGPLRVDFYNGTIKKTTLNSKDVELKYDGQALYLDAKLRTDGVQHLTVAFERSYDPEANGLYLFEDPKDKRVYIYSNLEPNFANAVFPCFDQPDIKATFKMRVTAPSEWIVVTSTLPEKSEVKDGLKTWNFPTSAKMATYVWSLYAGPYHVFEDLDKKVVFPTRLLMRESIANQIKVNEWFPIIRDGLKFYGEFFNTPYPYGKMDFIFVPEFNWGGMENIAAIALSERFLKLGDHTREDRLHNAAVALHEIAHMWFGDLVTTKWWDNLWLNESFATFAESISIAQVGFPEASRAFNDQKQWAYSTDEKVTTHPIQGIVENTSQAQNDFDGITYGKGASVLKQLYYLIGEDRFRAGLKSYFDKFHNGNAVLADFISALSQAASRPLESWSDQWLKNAGLNNARLQLTCLEGKISSAKILQTASVEHPLLREQAMKIAFLRGTEKLQVKEVFRVVFSGESTQMKELEGKTCPAIVFLNFEDFGYAKFRLDESSLRELKKSIGSIEDPFVRQLGWNYLWSLVQDGELNVKEFAYIWLRELPHETDDQNISLLLHMAGSRHVLDPSLTRFYPKGMDEQVWRAEVDKVILAEIQKAKPGSDREKHFLDGFISLASTPDVNTKLAAWLDGRGGPAPQIDQERRWAALKHLASFGFEGVLSRVDAELKQDSSARAQELALAAKVTIPSAATKKQSFESLEQETSPLSFSERKIVMENMFPVSQTTLRKEFSSRFYKDLATFVGPEPKSDFFLESYMYLIPVNPGPMNEAREFLKKHDSLPTSVKRSLRESIEAGEKLERIEQTASGTLK
jgi:aminopeptidase N